MSAPPPSRSRATSGRSAWAVIAAKQNSEPRRMMRVSSGDRRKYRNPVANAPPKRSGGRLRASIRGRQASSAAMSAT